MRESPILTLISHLKQLISGHCSGSFAKGFRAILIKQLPGAILLVLGVDHNIYRDLTSSAWLQAMRTASCWIPEISFDRQTTAAAGFEYHLLGDQ